MKFGYQILKYQEDMLETLRNFVAIPSVCADAEPGMPFGKASADALAFILKTADGMGLPVKNVGNYAGHTSYGSGTEFADVLTHVDVVPAGENWTVDPFAMTRKGNLCYGRGIADDKSAAVAALYCLKALKDAGITGKRCLRAVFGAGEEIASRDLDVYYASEAYPVMGFTPDCCYGICNCEKGILRLKFSGSGKSSPCVRSFRAGTVVNAVPATAEAVVTGSASQYSRLEQAAEGGAFRLEKTPEGLRIVSFGRASHGAEPERGKNAAAHLIMLLSAVFSERELGGLLSFLSRCIATEYDGKGLGIAQQDAPSGPLTLNLGIVSLSPDSAEASVDIRYPVTSDGEEIVRTARETARPYPISVEVINAEKPLYLPEDLPLISILKAAYRDVTGKDCDVFSTGGGTYARKADGKVVAFGPGFPDQPANNAHNADEHIGIDSFMLHAQICLEAMYRMMTE